MKRRKKTILFKRVCVCLFFSSGNTEGGRGRGRAEAPQGTAFFQTVAVKTVSKGPF